MNAAIESLVELGYTGASTSEIAKRAGVSRGAMLHHYPSKADLMAGAVEHLIELRHARFRESVLQLQRADTPVGSVLEMIWAIYAGPTLDAWMELVVAGRTDPALRQHLQSVDERFFEQARSTAVRLVFGQVSVDERADADAEVVAFSRMVLAFFDGLVVNRMVNDNHADRVAALELFESLVAHWMASR